MSLFFDYQHQGAVASMAFVVALGGDTNSGKTTICQFLERVFRSEPYNRRVLSMHLDDYFRCADDPHHVHLAQFDHHDWDSLNALDIDRFIDDLESNRDKYDLLLVEGFLILNIAYPSNGRDQVFDLIYYFDLPYDECHRRRITRRYDPPDPPGYFTEHVWNASVKAKVDALERWHNSTIHIINTSEQSFDEVQTRLLTNIGTALSNLS
jgi:nicotinamide/nicotinate riboside kinase